eukprot:130453_1
MYKIQNAATTINKFKPLSYVDNQTNITCFYQHIAAGNDSFKNFSPEEMRLMDSELDQYGSIAIAPIIHDEQKELKQDMNSINSDSTQSDNSDIDSSYSHTESDGINSSVYLQLILFVYPNKRLECWVEAPLEILYRYWFYNDDFKQILQQHKDDNKTWNMIQKHFIERQHYNDSTNIETFLENAKSKIVESVIQELNGIISTNNCNFVSDFLNALYKDD